MSSLPADQLRLSQQLTAVQDQQKRLTGLFLDGDLPESVLRGEANRTKAEQKRLERELSAGRGNPPWPLSPADAESLLPTVAQRVRDWVLNAEGEKLQLLLNALDIRIRACRDRAVIEAAIPLMDHADPTDDGGHLVTIEQTSA